VPAEFKILANGNKLYKASCLQCGSDRGYQAKVNLNKRCVPCASKLNPPVSESTKKLLSEKLKGNKNSKGHGCPLVTEEHKARKRQEYKEAALLRYKTDPSYRLTRVLRSRLNMAVRNSHKAGSAVRDLGCSIVELKKHLELQFQLGMTWDNWTNDGWHIDHKLPLSSFDLTKEENVKIACHYTNLQPLWAADNIRKGGV
jgi:hypothetical protein